MTAKATLRSGEKQSRGQNPHSTPLTGSGKDHRERDVKGGLRKYHCRTKEGQISRRRGTRKWQMPQRSRRTRAEKTDGLEENEVEAR